MADFNLEAMSLKELRQLQKDLAKVAEQQKQVTEKADDKPQEAQAAEKEVAKSLEQLTQEATEEVRDAVARVRSDLPGEMRDPIVSKSNLAGTPILTYTIASSRMDDVALSWFVDNDIAKAMLSVKGVGAVARVGGVDRRDARTDRRQRGQRRRRGGRRPSDGGVTTRDGPLPCRADGWTSLIPIHVAAGDRKSVV
mgnify:CR=1 FL=1